jgi:predicted HicB family RNase H-like nuclease
VNVDKSFLDKNLKDIFSENISSRFYNFPETYNKSLIDSLINEKDEEKKIFFTELFNITFLDCLKHFRGEIYINELGGLNCFENDKEKILDKCGEDGDDYVETLKYYLDNFEKIVIEKSQENSGKN